MSVRLGEDKITDIVSTSEGIGGTNNYNELDNKPQINGVTLQGNLTTADLNIETGTVDAYTKKETQALIKSSITGKADTTYVDNQLDLKADKSTTYTKTEVDNNISSLTQNISNKLSNKADKSDTYTKTETIEAINNTITGKADTTYVNNQLDLKADKSDTYTKEEVDDMFDNPTITGDTLPVGSITLWSGTTTPTNWLLCDGREVSRETYSELFAAIGTVWGAGDGSTSFNLPDFTDKFALGAGGDVDLAETGGEKTHKMTMEELVPHTHTTGHGTENGGSSYDVALKGRGYSSSESNFETSSTGEGAPFSIMPPYVGSYYIIKAKQSAGIIATVVDTLESSSTTDALSAKQGKILNDKTVTFEKTTNGFNLKFANGFMIQKKKLTRVSVNCNTSAGDNGLFYGTYDMGDWDVPFTELFDFTYTIGKVYGARQAWLSSNTWNGTDHVEEAPNNTWCGKLNMYLNWGSAVSCDLTCTGFGMWK